MLYLQEVAAPMWEAACDFTAKNMTVLKPVFDQAKVRLQTAFLILS